MKLRKNSRTHVDKTFDRELNKKLFVEKLNALDNPEKDLFVALKKAGLKVQRNKPYQVTDSGRYRIVDIVCEEKKLFIEVDGYSHKFRKKADRRREAQLLAHNPLFVFMRFTNNQVRNNLKRCVKQVLNFKSKYVKEFKPRVILRKGGVPNEVEPKYFCEFEKIQSQINKLKYS